MCLFSTPKTPKPEPTPPVPKEPDPDAVSANLNAEQARRRAAAFGTRATTLTSPLGVSNYGAASQPGVTLLGRA